MGCDGTVVAMRDASALSDASRDSATSFDASAPGDGAVSCGNEGLPCCAGSLCSGTLVCEVNVCRAQTACGAADQPCCVGSSCRSGLVCQMGTCAGATACGMRGQSCCSGACEAGLRCASDRCEPCGTLGQPCCGGGACGASLTCQSDRCQPCGSVGQPCCGAACSAGTECSAGTCRGVDRDMDGSPAGLDCDDSDPRRAPGMRERCDQIDNDCSGVADDGNACGLWIYNGTTWSAYALDPGAEMGAPSPHAPSTPIRFTLDIERPRLAYVFTDSTYHLMDTTTRQWTQSGPRASLIAQLAGASTSMSYCVPAGFGGGDANLEGCAVATPGGVLQVQYNITSRQFVYNRTDPIPTWMPAMYAPNYGTIRAGWVDTDNANGWFTTAPSSVCAMGGATPGPYLAVIDSDRVHFFEASVCFLWAPTVPFASFTPFTRPGAPPLARIASSFMIDRQLFVLGTR